MLHVLPPVGGDPASALAASAAAPHAPAIQTFPVSVQFWQATPPDPHWGSDGLVTHAFPSQHPVHDCGPQVVPVSSPPAAASLAASSPPPELPGPVLPALLPLLLLLLLLLPPLLLPLVASLALSASGA
jgi:hypothetical protein